MFALRFIWIRKLSFRNVQGFQMRYIWKLCCFDTTSRKRIQNNTQALNASSARVLVLINTTLHSPQRMVPGCPHCAS